MVALNFLSHAYVAPEQGSHYQNLQCLPYFDDRRSFEVATFTLSGYGNTMAASLLFSYAYLAYYMPSNDLTLTNLFVN